MSPVATSPLALTRRQTYDPECWVRVDIRVRPRLRDRSLDSCGPAGVQRG